MDRHPNAEARRAFYERIGAHAMTPLWEVLHALVPQRPASPVAPAHWARRHAAASPTTSSTSTNRMAPWLPHAAAASEALRSWR